MSRDIIRKHIRIKETRADQNSRGFLLSGAQICAALVREPVRRKTSGCFFSRYAFSLHLRLIHHGSPDVRQR